MNTKSQSTQPQKAYQREIEGTEFLENFQCSMIQMDLSVGGINTSLFIDKLDFTNGKYMLVFNELDDEIVPICLSKEQILEIELEYEEKITIHMLSGTISISKI